MKIENYISIIDSNRFGYNVAKIDKFGSSPEEILSFLKCNNVRLVLCKVPLEELSLINKLESLNFTIKDIQVTYKYDLEKYENKNDKFSSDIIVRDFNKNDISILQEIASDSFKNYGHYANDKKLDINKCNQIYSDWIARSCEDKNVADKVFVAEYNNEIAGFLSFKIHNKDSNKYAAGGIGAVAKKFRNINTFKALSIEGLNWGKKTGLDWVEHNVLIDNYPVNRSFIKTGFYTYKSFVTMHNWIE